MALVKRHASFPSTAVVLRSVVVFIALTSWAAHRAHADEPRLHNMAGMAYLYSGKDREAFNEFVTSLRLDPNQAQPHFQIGRIFEKQGKYDLAVKQYQAAMAIDPSFPGAADAAKRLGFYVGPGERGQVSTEEVASRQEYSRRLSGAKDLMAASRWEDARRIVAGLLAERPTDGSLHLMMAQIHEGRKDLISAVASLRAAKKLLPQSVPLSIALARDLYYQGSFAEADQEAREALAVEPRNEQLFRLMARIAEARRDPKEAYRYLSEASMLNPQDPELKKKCDDLAAQLNVGHYNAALYYFYQAKDWKRAKDSFTKALKVEKLTPEQSSIAQSLLIVADATLAELAKQIAQIQNEKRDREFGYLDKRLTFDEAAREPSLAKPGRNVDFSGWIVSVDSRPDGADLVVSVDQRDRYGTDETDNRSRRVEGIEVIPGFTSASRSGGTNLLLSKGFGFRAATDMARWFICKAPKPLPRDDRIRSNSQIRVLGKLAQPTFIRNVYNNTYSRFPQPVVMATRLEITRETGMAALAGRVEAPPGRGSGAVSGPYDAGRYAFQSSVNTPPGIAGTLRIDFLTMPVEPATPR